MCAIDRPGASNNATNQLSSEDAPPTNDGVHRTCHDRYRSSDHLFPSPELSTFSKILANMSSTRTSVTQSATAVPARLAIKNEHLAGLDPEWVQLWHNHGAHMVRADEVSIEEYRENPAAYSFTYPTYAGRLHSRSQDLDGEADPRQGPDVFAVQDLQVPVSTPSGEITVRMYSPEGPGPFPVHLNFHGGNCFLCKKETLPGR